MAYNPEEVEELFKDIITQISRDGLSLRKVLAQSFMPSSKTFYEWIDNDKEKVKQYARACKDRQDLLFDEIIEIADENDADVYLDNGVAKIDGNTVQRSRLKVDARKWALSKMNPKKYGDKLDIKSDDKPIKSIPIVLQDGRTYEDLRNDLKPE
jgi:hypothetical protein